MRKSLIVAVLLVCLCFALTSCGGAKTYNPPAWIIGSWSGSSTNFEFTKTTFSMGSQTFDGDRVVDDLSGNKYTLNFLKVNSSKADKQYEYSYYFTKISETQIEYYNSTNITKITLTRQERGSNPLD